MQEQEEAPGLGTESGANEAGSQNPDHSPGATPEGEVTGGGQSPKSDDAPDNPVGSDDPEASPEGNVPQEGEIVEDPERSTGSN